MLIHVKPYREPIVYPFAAIQLWIATTREGLGAALKGIGRAVARAFAPRSVLIYAVGLLIFGVTPYFLIFTRMPVSNWWVEVGLLAARLALALIFVLFGWVMQLALKDVGIDRLAIPIRQLVAMVVVAAIIGVLAAIWPARRAARINVLDAIAYE